MKLFFALLTALAFSAPAFGDGIRGIPIFGNLAPDPDGEGHFLVGEISELRDIDSNELVGYVFHRPFRSYYIDLNEGQPHIEAWDFPLSCSSPGTERQRLPRFSACKSHVCALPQ